MSFAPPLTLEEIAPLLPSFQGLAIVGQGGQGIVIRAMLLSDPPKLVALKIYFPGSQTDRTNREIAALRSIRCAALTTLESAGLVRIRGQQCTFVATNYIEGCPLSDHILGGAMAEADVSGVGIDIAKAINELWAFRVVHRDIKPANIMRRTTGECVLIDLGVARHLSQQSLTAMGNTWGTSGYMSPEHALAVRQLSCKTDIFSLGITMQECLLGKHPTGGDQRTLMIGGTITSLLDSAVSPQFAAIIDSMIQPRPETRPHPRSIIEQLKNLFK